MFSNRVTAWTLGNEDLVEFYQTRFRPEFVPPFEAWMATHPASNPDAPEGPFEMPEYKVSRLEEADPLQQEAGATFDEGRAANQQSDDYTLNALILASVLFLRALPPALTGCRSELPS